MSVPFQFLLGTTVRLTDEYGRERKYYVRQVRQNGWMFEPYERSDDREFHSGESVYQIYAAGRMVYERWNADKISPARLRRRKEAWHAQTPKDRRETLRKWVFVREFKKEIAKGTKKAYASEKVRKAVVAEYGPLWASEDVAPLQTDYDRRLLQDELKPNEIRPVAKIMKVPGERTLWGWVQRYVEAGETVHGLIADHADKGNRKSKLGAAEDEVVETYIKDHMKGNSALAMGTAFNDLNKLLGNMSLTKIGRKSFGKRVRRHLLNRDLSAMEFGKKAARRVGIVAQPTDVPPWSTNQGEIDHTLINLNVVDDESDVTLGRPWVSLSVDRIGAPVTGIHVSFLSPQWATLSRLLAHTMAPKDLSAFPHLNNRWLQHGIMDEVISDRGTDMISSPGRAHTRMIGYELVNVGSYQPWLRPRLERKNRTLKGVCLDYKTGISSFNNPDYDGRNNATVKLSEFISGLVEWAVDVENCGECPQFEGLSRNEVWVDGLGPIGAPRPIPDYATLRRSVMWPKLRTIQDNGVEANGYFYYSPELDGMKDSFPKGYKFLTLTALFDMGYMEILHPITKEWIVLWNKRLDIALGVPFYRSERYFDHAKLQNPDKYISHDMLLRSKEYLDDDVHRVRALGKQMKVRGTQNVLGRFLDTGRFVTPVNLSPVQPKMAPLELPGWKESGGVYSPTLAAGVALPVPASSPALTRRHSGAEGHAPSLEAAKINCTPATPKRKKAPAAAAPSAADVLKAHMDAAREEM